MSTVAILNDTHFGVRNGSDVFSDYAGRFFTEVFFPFCVEHEIKEIIHLGDYFDHRKYVNFKTIDVSRRLVLDKLTEHGIKMTIIPGNHDCYFKNTNDLCSLTQVLHHPNVKVLMEPAVVNYYGLDIALLPWICDDNREASMDFINTAPAPIMMAHLELSGFTMMRGLPVISHGLDKKLFSRFEMVLSGHYHTRSEQDNIKYLGTQFELTWSDCNDPKFFHVLDCSTRELIPVRNSLTLFKKLIYDDSGTGRPLDYIKTIVADIKSLHGCFVKIVIVSKRDAFAFERFIDMVNAVSPFELKIVEASIELNPSDMGEDGEIAMDDTATLLNKYVDSLTTDLDKERIKSRMQYLLTEAEHLEVV
jgi:DNA repair exonuclease SbcCD nuclease subunit